MRRRPSSISLMLVLAAGCGEVPYAAHPPSVDAGVAVDAGVEDADSGPMGEDGGDAVSPPLGPLPTPPECISCARTPCFTPGLACVNDPVCVDCFNDNRGSACATSKTWLALLTCACEAPSPCIADCAATCATRP